MVSVVRAAIASIALAFLLAGCTPDQLSSGDAASLHRQPPGTVVTGRVQVGRAVFDLPDGEWTVVSAAEPRRSSVEGGQSGFDAQVMLMRFNAGTGGDRVLGLISITASATNRPVLWSRNRNCENQTSLHIVDSYKSEIEHDCWYVTAYRPNWKFENAQPFELAGVRYAAAKIDLVPVSLLGTHHWIVRRDLRITMSHYAAVSTFGIVSQNSNDWIEAVRIRSPGRMAAFERWVEYSAQRHRHYADGLTNRLPPFVPAPPVVTPISSLGGPAPARL